MATENLTKKGSASEQVKAEFRTIRDELIELGKITFDYFSDYVTGLDEFYNDRSGIMLIRNVYYGRKADYNLLQYLIQYKEERV